jgi:hypothetical protein
MADASASPVPHSACGRTTLRLRRSLVARFTSGSSAAADPAARLRLNTRQVGSSTAVRHSHARMAAALQTPRSPACRQGPTPDTCRAASGRSLPFVRSTIRTRRRLRQLGCGDRSAHRQQGDRSSTVRSPELLGGRKKAPRERCAAGHASVCMSGVCRIPSDSQRRQNAASMEAWRKHWHAGVCKLLSWQPV